MRRKLLALGLILALFCASCGRSPSQEGPAEGEAAVWFLADINGEKGSALAAEYRPLPQGEELEGLLTLLLSGPEELTLTSPFPRGTAVKSWRLEGNLVLVDMSEAYGGLSGAGLSLADGCIVLTLCQLAQVERVYLTVEGRPRPFRDLVLSPQDFLLENGAGEEAELEVQLWFPGNDGLAAEERTLTLRMGDRIEIAALQALLAGPESGELWPICPEGTSLLSLTVEGKRCIVDVSETWLEAEEDPCRVESIAATLSQRFPGVQVELRVEGQPEESILYRSE